MINYLKNPPDIIKKFYPVIIFGIIGSLNSVFSFFLFTLFWKYCGFHYLVAISYTYVITSSIQFFANRKLTFKCVSGNIYFQILKYLCMLGINYLITLFLMRYLVSHLDLSPYASLCLVIVCTATTGFLLFKFWIFK